MGQLPFSSSSFRWHKFVSLYLAHTSPAWERRRAAVVGMIWYELKLFPNRLHEVWSCPPACLVDSLHQCQPEESTYYITSALFPPRLLLSRSKTANNNNGVIFSVTLRLKVPQPYYLWLVEGGGRCCVIVFPCSTVGAAPLRVWSVSVILHQPPAAGLWPEGGTEDSQRKWLCFLFFAALKKVVSYCSWTPSTVVCGLICNTWDFGVFVIVQFFNYQERLQNTFNM